MPRGENPWTRDERERLGYTKEWLIEQYHEKGRTMVDIGKELGKDPKTVLFWFRSYGIETRPRGYGVTNHRFKKGEPSKFKGHKHSTETKEKLRKICLEDGRVPYLKDGKHWLKQDGAHPSSWKGGVTPERQALYASEEWNNAVKTVWRRDNATCRRCGKSQRDNREEKFHIHHLYPFADYGTLRAEPDNLVLLCKDCHHFVHSKKNTKKEFCLSEAAIPKWLKGEKT